MLGVGAVLLVSLGVLVLQAASFGRGLDFWDESYVLLLVDRPDASRAAGELFLFQFVLRPVFVALGQDVALFRLAGLALLAAAAIAATQGVAKWLRCEGIPVRSGWERAAYLVTAACATTAYVGAGRVPGYRIVVLCGLLLAMVGLARIRVGAVGTGAAVVGSAGVLVFTGKPTSAVALALVTLVVLVWLVPRRVLFRTAVSGLLGVVCAVIVVLVLAGMTPSGAVEYLWNGVQTDAATDAHGSLAFMLGWNPVPMRVLIVFGPLILLPLLFAGHDAARHADSRWPVGAQVLAGVGVPAGAAVLGVWLLSAQEFGGQIRMLTLLWAVLAVGAVVLAVRLPKAPGVGRGLLVLVGLLCLMPYVATVGTNTNFTPTMAQASIFWVLALMAATAMVAHRRPRAERLVVPIGLFLVTTTALTQVVWMADALEGRGVREASVTVPVLGGRLVLEPDTAAVIAGLGRLSEERGLAGRPAIDLTGYGAGYQLALRTTPLGRASFFGTFSGAARGAEVALAAETCRDRATALVLYADDNPLDVSSAIATWGVDLETDYEEVARFQPTHGTEPIRRQTVHVLLPTPGVAAALGCEAPDG